jgi:hypothetical protein
MYQLYCILKDRDVPPTPDEIAIASGKKRLDGKTEAEYFKKLERASENIKKAFEEQQARGAVCKHHPFNNLRLMIWRIQQGPWDQEKFEQILTEWIVACDQPFEEVEKQEFVTMMNFVRHTGSPLKIPKRQAIKRRVMKMGEQIIEGVREMFMVRYFFLGFVVRCINYQGRNSRERSAFPWTRGHQAISTRFWPSLHTM